MDSLKIIVENDTKPPRPQIRIVDTTPNHLMLMRLRAEDADECISFGVSPRKVLWNSYREGFFRKSYFIDDEIAAVSGCAGSLLGDTATPYLLTTDAVKKISPLQFTRIYQREVYNFLSVFPVLSNFVDSRYTSAVRLLEIIGFTLHEPVKYGEGMFRQFEIRRA